MGKKASFVRDRQRSTQKSFQRRERIGEQRKAERRGETETSRITAPRKVYPLPSESDVTLLVNQVHLSAQIPEASRDLVRMINKWGTNDAEDVGAKRKRNDDDDNQSKIEAVAAALVKDPSATKQIMFDDFGSNVVVSILNALAKQSSALAKDIVGILMEQKNEETLINNMSRNGNARRVVMAALEAADEKQLKSMAALLGISGGKRDTKVVNDVIIELSTHRHGSAVLTKFADRVKETASTIANALLSDAESIDRLVTCPFSSDVLSTLVRNGAVSDKDGLLTTSLHAKLGDVTTGKRASKALLSLLEARVEGVSEKLIQLIGSESLVSMATDSRQNFLLQGIFGGADSHTQSRLFDMWSANIPSWTMHGIGAHVVVSICNASDTIRTKIVRLLASQFVEVATNRNASLVVRKLLAFKDSCSKVIELLEKHIGVLVTDASGNIVVQHILENAVAQRNLIIEKLCNGDLVGMSKHQFAAHVVVKLLGVLDVKSMNSVVASLRPHVLQLVQHVNGRFVVEKLIGPSKEIRDMIVSNFVELAKMKGTQHVLAHLFEVADGKTRQHLINSVIAPAALELSTHQNATLVVQKLLQAETGEKKLAERIRSHVDINTLRQDFFGKFVANFLV